MQFLLSIFRETDSVLSASKIQLTFFSPCSEEKDCGVLQANLQATEQLYFRNTALLQKHSCKQGNVNYKTFEYYFCHRKKM